MFRNTPFNIKTALFLPLFSLSIYFLYLSYENFQNIILDQAIVIKSDDYNYFDPVTFRKYYDEILIENLNSPIISELENEELTEKELKEETRYKIHLININPGDNFASVLKRSGIKAKDIDKIIFDGKKYMIFQKFMQEMR